MAHDVFISYSSKDKPTADAICANLESAGVRCWIAPRDIIPGLDFPTAISNAISASRLMVLVFSTHSNSSPEVGRELILAANKNLITIPFKIDNSTPEPGKDYYLARTHWLDAMNPPTQEQIDKLVEYAQAFLSIQPPEDKTNPDVEDGTPEKEPVRPPVAVTLPPVPPSTPRRRKLWFWGIPLVLAIAGGSIYGILSNLPGAQPAVPTVTPTSMVSTVDAAPTTVLTLTPSLPAVQPSASKQAEIQTLSSEISALIKLTTSYSAYSYSIDLKPDENGTGVSVKLDSFLSGDPNGTQSFTLPGEYSCKASKDGTGDYSIAFQGKEDWNLGFYEESVADALCDKFTRLNTLLEPPSASRQTEIETLSAEISALIPQNMEGISWTFTGELKPNEKDVSVTLEAFLNGEHQNTQNFTLPGDWSCKVSEGGLGYLVELFAKENWNLGPYEESIANSLCDKFTRLNTILVK